jgi:predicted transcriptional regulator
MTKPTTIRLDARLKKRIDKLAVELDQSAHSLMVEGIERAVSAAEEKLAFEAEVSRRARDFDRRGLGYTLDDLVPWFEAAARGKKIRLPKPRRFKAER